MSDAALHDQTLRWYHCLLPSALLHLALVYVWCQNMPETSMGVWNGQLQTPMARAEITVDWEAPKPAGRTMPVLPEIDPFEETTEIVRGPEIHLFEPKTETISQDAVIAEAVVQTEDAQPEREVYGTTDPIPHHRTETDAAIAGNHEGADLTASLGGTGESSQVQAGSGNRESVDGVAEPLAGGRSNGTQPEDEAELWRSYTKMLSAHFKKYKFYPEMARKQRLSGTVLVAVEIRRDGTVADVHIEGTSGIAMLDQAALQSARRASPVPAFPTNVRADSRKVVIPYRYQLTE